MKIVHKSLIKYSAATVLVLSVLSLISFVFVSILAPKTIATFVYDLGSKSMSEHYFQKQYEKTKSINDLYNVYVLNIMTSNSDKIIENYELLEADADYKRLIDDIKQETYDSNTSVYLKAVRLAEDSYIKSAYLKELLNSQNNGLVAKGLSFLLNTTNTTVTDQSDFGVYLFDQIITEEKLAITTRDGHSNLSVELSLLFQDKLLNSGVAHIEDISQYLENLTSLFNDLYYDITSSFVVNVNDVADLFAIANQINKVSSNLVAFNRFVNEHTNIYQDFNVKQVNVLSITQISAKTLLVNSRLSEFVNR